MCVCVCVLMILCIYSQLAVFNGMVYDLMKHALSDQLEAEEVADVSSQLITNLVS